MMQFIRSVLHSHQVEDGTRRAAMETMILARENLQEASSKLSDTIRDLITENDRVTRRPMKNEKPHK